MELTFFIHRFNPVVFEIFGVRIWYYGLIYALGFFGVHIWFRFRREKLNWSVEEVYSLSLFTTVGVLLIGHTFEIVVYEWDYYRAHPVEALKYWRGGMATHGVLLGAIFGMWLFCRQSGRQFLAVADEIVIPAAFFMGIGRIGNFINGENFGPVTDVWWAVQFPYAEGFRHPVDLYDSAKNFVVLGILLCLQRTGRQYSGKLLSHFLFWYGFLRLLIDIFREYGSYFHGLGRGQYFNILMAAGGLVLMLFFSSRPAVNTTQSRSTASASPLTAWKKVAFALLLLFSLTIPSGWSQGWLEQLKERAGLHSYMSQ